MTARIDYVELPATDITATKAFYADAFGWEWIDYGPTYAASTSSGIEVGLNTGATVGPSHAADAQDAIGPLVLFQVDDLAEVERSVAASGASIVSGPYPYPGGNRFHFADPSGNMPRFAISSKQRSDFRSIVSLPSFAMHPPVDFAPLKAELRGV